MYKWVYIATPSGASLGRTISLAKGDQPAEGKPRRKVFGVGVIRRQIGSNRPYLRELRPGDRILLMYNLFHAGVIYPIGTFRIIPPRRQRDPAVTEVDGYPAIGELSSPGDLETLDPEYTSSDGREHVILGTFKELTSEDRLRLYRRTDKADNALHPAGPTCPLESVDDEDQAAAIVREALVPRSARWQEARRQLVGSGWPVALLDGRAQQLLIECRMAESALGDDALSHALPAQPLCALAEHELQTLLTCAARSRLGKPMADLKLSWRDSRGAERQYWLSWIPDHCVHEYDMYDSTCALKQLDRGDTGIPRGRLKALADRLDTIRQIRNRVAHSHFLEEHHYRKLRDLVSAMLKTIHSD